MVLIVIGIGDCSFALSHVIDKGAFIVISIFEVVVSDTIFHSISELSLILLTVRIVNDTKPVG